MYKKRSHLENKAQDPKSMIGIIMNLEKIYAEITKSHGKWQQRNQLITMMIHMIHNDDTYAFFFLRINVDSVECSQIAKELDSWNNVDFRLNFLWILRSTNHKMHHFKVITWNVCTDMDPFMLNFIKNKLTFFYFIF